MTGVKQLVVNLHWSTANVNLIVDGSHCLSYCLIVSKYAKAIIPGEIAPVQWPGHSWSRRNMNYMGSNVNKCSNSNDISIHENSCQQK